MTFFSKVYYSEMLTTKLDSKEKPQGLYSAVAHVYTIHYLIHPIPPRLLEVISPWHQQVLDLGTN